MIHKNLPAAKIYFLSIKPSPSRAAYHDEFLKANALIRQYIKGKPNSLYIDLDKAIYSSGTTRPDSTLFENDYLHLNSTGYDRWQKVLAPYVN